MFSLFDSSVCVFMVLIQPYVYIFSEHRTSTYNCYVEICFVHKLSWFLSGMTMGYWFLEEIHCFVHPCCLWFLGRTWASGLRSLVSWTAYLAFVEDLLESLFNITLILFNCEQAKWCLVFSLGATLCWRANGLSDIVSVHLWIGSTSLAALENCVWQFSQICKELFRFWRQSISSGSSDFMCNQGSVWDSWQAVGGFSLSIYLEFRVSPGVGSCAQQNGVLGTW